jgi:CHAT domain-containing protein/tetratricopeptide (TPR) repeat protein
MSDWSRCAVRCHCSRLLAAIVGISKPRLWFLMVLLPVGVLAGCYFLLHQITSSSPAHLLAKAYFERRTLELRIGVTPHSPIRIQRGQQISRMDRPESLLDAEAAIARGLRNAPENGSLLMARGQANLLESSYEAAITDMQEALDTQPKSAAVLNGLATAYFERAEAEDRFDDYGTAFELQSRALQQSPDDPVTLFNRAITGARLYLYKQSIEDWHRYLSLDASGEWSDEAEQRLSEVQEIVDAHDKRTKAPLLTPAEFVQTVDTADPKTWEAVEPRIEEYLSVAIKDWLPAAFPVVGKVAASVQSKQALGTLAVILKERHGDLWLTDLLLATASPSFGLAADALKKAAIADNADYMLGRKEAARAAQLFSQAGNPAGEIAARFEEVYAFVRSEAGPECLKQINNLAVPVENRLYPRLQIRLGLERYNCLVEQGDFQGEKQLTAAYHSAQSAHYETIELRILDTLATDDLLKGNRPSGLTRCRQGLRQYWASSVDSYVARGFYTTLGFSYEKSELWHLARAADDQDLAIASPTRDPISLAFEHVIAARASVTASEPRSAQEHLNAAQHLFSSAPNSDVTENYRVTLEAYLALVDDESGKPETGLARLERMRPRLDRIANMNIVADFYRITGELQSRVGHLADAEDELIKAVSLGETMRASLRSESNRILWMRQWAKPYLDLVDVELQRGNPSEALNIWELYRDFGLRQPPQSSNPPASPGTQVEAAVASTRMLISQESERVTRTFSALHDQTALILGLIPHGVVIWAYDDRGLDAKWVQEDPANIRLRVTRLAELASHPSSSLEGIRLVAGELHNDLIGPLSDRIQAGRTLIIQTDEALAAVPFQILVDGSGKYLEDEHPVAYLPILPPINAQPGSAPINASTRALVAASTGGSADGLRPLGDVLAEAKAVIRYFPQGQLLADSQASLNAVIGQLSRAEIFHFAGHAVAEGNRNGLLLNAGLGTDEASMLDAEALRRVSLPGLQMAVLSACSTENGEAGMPGDSDSLALVFLAKGVPHVIASRWNVDSSSTVFLMEVFYGKLLAGASVPQALASAEAALRQRAPHPYYWAAFDAFGQN